MQLSDLQIYQINRMCLEGKEINSCSISREINTYRAEVLIIQNT